MKSTDLVRSYLDDPHYADMPSLTLAKILLLKHPQGWANLNLAHCTVRAVRGQKGKGRTRVSHKRAPGHQSDGQDCSLPTPRYEDLTHYDARGKRALVICDLHIPYHDRAPLESAVKDGLAFGVDTLIILGDFWDFHRAAGSFDPERGSAHLAEEIKDGQEALQYLRAKFKRCELVFLRGNHDSRLDKFLFKRAETMWGIREYSFKGITRLESYGFHLAEENAMINFGKLILLHGHEICRSKNAVSAARALFLKAGTSAAIGHFHQSSFHPFRRLGDEYVGCWSIGCLCYLHPRYAPYQPEWGHGHMLAEKDKEGNFWVQNKRIISGKIYGQ